MTPLQQLGEALRKKVTPPFEWVIEHAPDGSIQRLWNASTDGKELFNVAGYAEYRPRVALAACACIRTVLRDETTGHARAAVETVERWARGEATVAEANESRASLPSHLAFNRASVAAGYAAEFILSFVRYGGIFVSNAVESAAASEAHRRDTSQGFQWHDVKRAQLKRFARMLRERIPVAPTLAELLRLV